MERRFVCSWLLDCSNLQYEKKRYAKVKLFLKSKQNMLPIDQKAGLLEQKFCKVCKGCNDISVDSKEDLLYENFRFVELMKFLF